MYAIDPGETFVYEFEMRNRARLNFYHPHTHEATATQVYRGLAGAIIVNDDEETGARTPHGRIRDSHCHCRIAASTTTTSSSMAAACTLGCSAFRGSAILVNGRPDLRVDVASRAYRLRVLNGSNSRIYKLAWDDGTPIIVIGVDGGLLEQPETTLRHARARRTTRRLGGFQRPQRRLAIAMRSASFTGVLPPMAERMMGAWMVVGLPVGARVSDLHVPRTRAVGDSPALPGSLAKIEALSARGCRQSRRPVPIAISEAPMAMLLNRRAYADDDPLPRERVPVDTCN